MTDGQCRIRIRYRDKEIEIEGERDFVESNLSELIESVITPKLSDPSDYIPPSQPSPPSVKEVEALKHFYLEKNPQTQQDRVLVFIYWMQFKEGIAEPSIIQIKGCYDRLSVSQPARITDVTKDLRIKKKPPLLIKGKKKGHSRLSIDGQKYVEKQLPKNKT